MGPFDTQNWWYADVATNYVVNEHTITANSTGLQLLAWYAVGHTTSYTISAAAGANGSISPSGSVSVAQGASQLFSVSASPGYSVSSVVVDGVDQGSIVSYTFSNVQAGHAISATFAAVPTYTITASADANGSITPSGSVPVAQGASGGFTIAPNAGYAVSSVLVDGVSLGALTSYTFSNVQAAHTISASFVEVSGYTIAASAGANGSITPSGSVPVARGANQAFTVTPDTGYAVSSVVVDGVNKGAAASYTFTYVLANHTISAAFVAKPTYTITARAGANGTISPSGGVAVVMGASQAFTITPNPGHAVSSVVVDGVRKGATTSYTFTNVLATHTISAAFTNVLASHTISASFKAAFVITASAGANGTISPSGSVPVGQGASRAFAIRPNMGYAVSSVVVDGVSKGAITSYTFTNVLANHAISVTFKSRFSSPWGR